MFSVDCRTELDFIGRYKTTKWRKRRDSNPRYPFRYVGFQDRCHQPLGHSSALSKIPPPRNLRHIATPSENHLAPVTSTPQKTAPGNPEAHVNSVAPCLERSRLIQWVVAVRRRGRNFANWRCTLDRRENQNRFSRSTCPAPTAVPELV